MKGPPGTKPPEDGGAIEIALDGIDLRDGRPSRHARAHLFEPGRKFEPGDLTLTDPEDIRRLLETPVAYAKHVMILAEAFRRSTGATRAETIEYLSRMFLGLGDWAFGRTALRAFGPATGILDIYPLEVVVHVLDKYPWFLPKCGFSRLFDRTAAELSVPVGESMSLKYPENLQIRGFALAGGGRPGYVFEPTADPGRYSLMIDSPGRFEVLVSAVNEVTAHTLIDRLTIVVRARAERDSRPGLDDLRSYPPRDALKLAAWPVPPPPAPGSVELASLSEDPTLVDDTVEEDDPDGPTVAEHPDEADGDD